MRLKNKKTGEIKDTAELMYPDGIGEFFADFDSLAELNEEWEDYEEPKEYWYLENNGDIDKETYDCDSYEEKMIEIGNYFETREEAEQAVEKLKAWKRLKDKGFRFVGIDWRDRGTIGDYEIYARAEGEECSLDLDLLFGGEK